MRAMFNSSLFRDFSVVFEKHLFFLILDEELINLVIVYQIHPICQYFLWHYF